MINIDLRLLDGATPEAAAAKDLKRIFEVASWGKALGQITIIPNLRLYGERVSDIDILIVGRLQECQRSLSFAHPSDGKVLQRPTYINSFCWCVEVKDHIEAEFVGGSVFVKYRGASKDVSTQSHQQAHAVKSFMGRHLGFEPFVTNLIWLRNMSTKELPSGVPHNCLAGIQSLDTWFERACVVNVPTERTASNGRVYYNMACTNATAAVGLDDVKRLIDVFATAKANMGELTRRKVEAITTRAIRSGQEVQQDKGKLVLVRGRAGTGKTIKLLHLAHKLCTEDGNRCLLLTYNLALVSDIQRMLALSEFRNELAGPSLEIRTIHSFIGTLAKNLRLTTLDSAAESYDQQYDALKNELLDYLQQGAISGNEIREASRITNDIFDFDFVMVDEGQDWPQDERDLLIRIFGPDHLVVADGVDQLIRSGKPTNWTVGVPHSRGKLATRSLRQKRNLCLFVAAMAEELDIPWDVEPSDELVGGRIFVTTKPYTYSVHERLLDNTLKSGNAAYDMLLLTSSRLVDQTAKQFKLAEQWRSWGIRIWDGTSRNARTAFPSNIDEHRLLQYDSCRGLEGWTVVCLDFDYFVEEKWKYSPIDSLKNQMLSENEQRALYSRQWALIPLTRAIDTLLITLDDSRSEIANALRRVSERCSDFVVFVD